MTLIVADGIGSFLEKLPANTVELIGILGLVLLGLVFAIGGIWHQFRKSEIDGALKHEMIARGMSADDIERVLAAKSSTKGDKKTLPYTGPPKT